MQAESEKQQSWKIKVHARSKSCHFKLKATTTLPTSKFHRFSLFFRLHNFFLQLKSKPQTSFFTWQLQQQHHQQRPTLKSRILTAFQKLRARCVKNHNPDIKSSVNRFKRYAYKEPIRISSLVIGILSFVFRIILEVEYKRIVIVGLGILLNFAILFRKYVTGKSTTVLIFSVVAALVCLVLGFRLDAFMYSYQGFVSEFVFRAWRYIHTVSSGYVKFL